MRQFNPMNERDRMCLTKRRHATVEEAKLTAENIRKRAIVAAKLYVYECPYCHNYHLTKQARPLDPNLNDRVNIEV